MNKLNPDQWSSYWQDTGNINSFSKDNYDKDIAAFWQQEISDKSYIKVIDLACGNGAISWIANDIINKDKNTASITGVDFSNITPFERLKISKDDFPMIDFLGNTRLEKLPFENNTFDIAISQYGIEYSNLKQSIPEIARVLQPTSKLCLIIHSENSEIIQKTAKNLKQYEILLKEIRLHDDFIALDAIIGQETDTVKIRAMQAFIMQGKVIESKMLIVNQIIKTAENPDVLMRYKKQLVTPFLDQSIQKRLPRKEPALLARKTLDDYIKRINDLQNVALSDTEIDDLISLIKDHGFIIKRNEILRHDTMENAGHIIVAERNS